MAKAEIVMDTNVAVVANNRTDHVNTECVQECIAKLRHLRSERRLLLDDSNLIIAEYRKRLSFSGQPGVGDAFFKWLHENQVNPKHCRKVVVNPHPELGFEEFPTDPCLSTFDHDDRKFVAVALASGTNPEVLNASDTDWWHHRQALARNGVKVVFICPELMNV